MIERERIIQIFKASPTPTSIVNADDPRFTFVQVNDAYTNMTQRTPEELIGKSLFEAFPENPNEKKPTGVEKLRNSFQRVIATRKADEMETTRYDIVLDDGNFKEIYWKVINTPVLDEHGEVEFIINSATIITEQVLSERENNLMLNNTEDSFILIDRNLVIQNFNQLFAKNYKQIFDIDVKKGDSILDYAQPDRREIVKGIYERVFNGETIEGDLPLETREGDNRYFNIKYKPAIDENDHIIGSFISLIEKTEEHVAKLELEKNEARFRALAENGSDVLFILSPEGHPTYISPSIENVLGYTQKEANEMDMMGIVHPDDIEIIFSELKKCLEKPGEPIKVTPARMKHKNGGYRWFEGTITNMLHDPNINGVVDNFRDITERKQAEKKIEEAKDQYQSLIQTVDGIVWEADAETFIFNFVSPQSKEILGYEPEEWVGVEGFWKKKIHPDDRTEAVNYCHHQTQKGLNHSFEYRIQKADGEYIWMRDIVTVVHEKGKSASLRGLMMDITEKKEAEKKYRNVVEYSTNMFYQHDTEGVLNYVSEQSEYFLGYPPEEAMRNWTDFMTDHPINEVGEKHTLKALETGKIQPSYELQLKRADGKFIWVEVHEAPMIEDGVVTGIVGSLSDITERKKYEEQLQESLERYDYASKATRDAIYDWDIIKDSLHWGEGFKKLFGHKSGDGKYPIEKYNKSVHPADRDEAFDDLKFTLNDASMNKWSYEYRFQKDDGSYANVIENGYILRDEDGNAIRMIGAIRDVSESKQVELKNEINRKIAHFFKEEGQLNPILDKVLEFLANYNKFATAEIWLKNAHSTHLNLVANYARLKKGEQFYVLSKSRTQFQKGSGLPGLVWQNKKIELWNNIDSKKSFLRNKAAKKAGIKSAFGIPLFYNEEVTGVLVISSEQGSSISDQTVSLYEGLQEFLGGEIKRKQQEEEFQLLFESAPEILAVASPNGQFVRVNPTFCAILGYTEEELTTQPFSKFIHPDDLNNTDEEFSETISGARQADNFINRYLTKSGETVWISWYSSNVFGEDNFVFSYGRDVTETIKLEQLLQLTNRLARIGSWELEVIDDFNRDEVYWSNMAREIFEVQTDYNPRLSEDLEFFKPKSRDILQDAVKKAIDKGDAYDLELEIVTAKGNHKWVRCIGSAEFVKGKCKRIFGSIQDITEKKTTEIEFENIFKEKETILESIGDAFFAVDLNWTVTYWNKEAENILMKTREEVIGKNLWDEYKDAKDLEFYKQYHKAVNEQVTVNFEEYYPTVHKWFEVSAYPSENGLSVYFKDISYRKEAALQLEKAYKEKENILESIDDGFFTIDKNWTVTYWNVQAERLLHTPKRKILGQNLWDVFDDATDNASYTNYHRVMHQNVTVTFEDYYEPIDKWFDISAYPSAEGISVFFKDISERRKNEEKIRRINERFEKVTEATNDAIWDYDVVEENLFWGKGFETLFGYDPEEVNPTLEFLVSLIHPNYREHIMDKINKYMSDSTKSSWYEEYRFRKQDGSYAYVIDRANFIRNDRGEVIRVVGAMTDLTKQKKYEKNLKKLNTQLEERAKELAASNEELEQFAYVASHDLQEPLRMVSSFLTQLDKKYSDQLDEKANQYIHFAVDGAQRMRQIILDLLNYSRLNQDKNIREEVDLNKALQEVILLERSHIEDKGAKINVQELPMIFANPAAIKQVFKNLLNNALKYQEEGCKPEIEILTEELETHWKFTFTDNGIGIAPDFQENIFQIFHRLHTRDQYSGTGIGLAISKKIIERHGGQIWVESEEGKGSTFYFTIQK